MTLKRTRSLPSRVFVLLFIGLAVLLGIIGAVVFERSLRNERIQTQIEEIKRDMAPSDTLLAR
jgi:hypothetical protein